MVTKKKTGQISKTTFLIEKQPKSTLGQSIKNEYNNLVKQVAGLTNVQRTQKGISGTGRDVSVNELLAYQIGWGKLLISWYEAGVSGEQPDMPGEGFKTWDYKGLAFRFYEKYSYQTSGQYDKEFHQVAERIIYFVDFEDQEGQLDTAGVWSWTKLKSGKEWPLSKWVQVNTVAPYKKAAGWVSSVFGLTYCTKD